MFDTAYQFYGNHKKVDDNLVIYLFRFRPHKNRIILVEVEYHKGHPIAIIKFYEKRFKNSPERFNVLTGGGKFLPILRTCINIMLHLYQSNPYLSFGFCGAPTPKEVRDKETANSQRFRIYKYAMACLFSNLEFQHLAVDSFNLYFLMNRNYCSTEPQRETQLLQQIKNVYPGEDFWEEPILANILQAQTH